MSTKDQLLYSALHGTAIRYAAERRNLAGSITELREMAGGRDDILAVGDHDKAFMRQEDALYRQKKYLKERQRTP